MRLMGYGLIADMAIKFKIISIGVPLGDIKKIPSFYTFTFLQFYNFNLYFSSIITVLLYIYSYKSLVSVL